MPKILVADDSITVRKVAERLLTEAGLEVALAASGEEALAWLANERPDFIVTDVIMPDKSGYDVCNYVRSHADLSETPVLLISGIVNEDVTRKAESCRADGVLKKPFQGASLQDRVLELLAKRGEKRPASQEAGEDGSFSSLHTTAMELSAPTPAHDAVSVEDGVPESVSSMATPAEFVSSPDQKVFRITEERLQAFRLSTQRIKELEALLEGEKARGERLAEQAETGKQAVRRMHELEAALTDQQQRSTQEKESSHGNEVLETKNKELQSSLSEHEGRIAELTNQLNRLADVEKRNKELEASLENLRSQSMTSKSSEEGVPQLQALIAAQQQRLTEVASEVIRFSEAEAKIRLLEAELANEQSRAGAAETKINSLETALENERRRASEAEGKNQMLEKALAEEQSRAGEATQRCTDLEGAAARAAARLEDQTKLLAQIARLALGTEEISDRTAS
jgi:CheY-like chemotaxis protein